VLILPTVAKWLLGVIKSLKVIGLLSRCYSLGLTPLIGARSRKSDCEYIAAALHMLNEN